MIKSLGQQGLSNEYLIRLSLEEKIRLISKSIVVVILLDYCFYRSFWSVIPLCIPGVLFYREEKKDLLHKKKEEIRQQFKEMLYLVVSGQKAGYSVENAFLNSYEDLVNLYGEESAICRILSEIKIGMENHRPLADLWKTIGIRTDIVEIREFAEVFAIAKLSGGNMTAILENTAEILGNKAETKIEIDILLSARKLEQKIMNVMPLGLILYVEMTSPGYFDGMYHALSGIVIMTICVVIYIGAYIMGRRLAVIRI